KERLEQAHAAMALALNAGIHPSDVFDRQRTIDAELAARRDGYRVRVAEHIWLEAPTPLWESPHHLRVVRDGVEAAFRSVTELWAVRWGKPVLVAIFSGPGASLFLHSRYGYYAERAEAHKVCLPPQVMDSPPLLEQAALHEIAHAAVHDIAGDAVPRWLDEGIAVWTEGGCSPIENRRLRLAANKRRVPSMQQIEGSLGSYDVDLDSGQASLAYAAAGTFIAFLAERSGAGRVRDVLTRGRTRGDAGRALRATFGRDLRGLEAEWRSAQWPEGPT
ncbi:MAG: hypothetical protein FJX72_21810, partial [Armatimonadetes bacterium]|nr:hypothetical protein [Armatimonadota bacterium]